jgi:tRNA(adenine34) deaminase
MREAIRIAKEAMHADDVPVGAIVLNSVGEIVGTGNNRREIDHDPSAHAEIVALRAAALKSENWRLDGHTMVVTLEPCAMCAGAISQSRVNTLVFGAWDEKAGAVGSVWDVVRDPRSPYRVEVVSGVLAEECAKLLQDFFQKFRD